MTANKRIVLNVLATYGRTLFSIACGLFSVRWVLMVLGHEDFGLFGVVGSLAIFVNFLDIQLAGALGRFFAVALGRKLSSSVSPADGLRECREWFSCGVMIHTVVPTILFALGWIIGSMVIRSGWLTIPSDKVPICIWLWRFVCISSFVTMANAPFRAMYTAKQEIAELTLYSFLQTFVKTSFIYMMTVVPGDWLFGYGLGVCLISTVPQFLICIRACWAFPECRLIARAMIDRQRIMQIGMYAGWQTFGGIGYMARHQCLEIIVNRYFGPKVNAAYTVGSTFGGEAAVLTSALNGAFGPVVATAYGANNLDYMRKMAFRSCKFGSLLTLMFAVPMFVEVDEVLRLWLKSPPSGSAGLCLAMLVVVVIEKMTMGYVMAVNATGNVARFQCIRGLCCLTAIPFAVIFILLHDSVYAVSLALLLTTCIVAVSDIVLGRSIAGMRWQYWMKHVFFPLVLVGALCLGCAYGVRMALPASFLRVCLTTLASLIVFALAGWRMGLDEDERSYLENRLRMAMARRFRGGNG